MQHPEDFPVLENLKIRKNSFFLFFVDCYKVLRKETPSRNDNQTQSQQLCTFLICLYEVSSVQVLVYVVTMQTITQLNECVDINL